MVQTVGFEQAAIKIEKEKEFEELKGAVSAAFGPEKIELLLKRLNREGLRVRDWDSVLARGVLEREVGGFAKPALALYQSLTVSDQAQTREFYLSRVEEVDPKLREKFQRLYRYY